MKILFICLGNICRSPLALGIAKEYIKNHNLNIEVDSCGTSSWHIGESPDKRSIEIAKKYGIDISKQKCRQISIYGDANWDYYIVMDENNKRDLIDMGFDKEKIKKIGEFGANNAYVPDPYKYKDIEGFENVFNMIFSCIENMFSKEAKII